MSKSNVRYNNGYKTIYLPEHHRSLNGNWSGYVYEHIVIAEDIVGRQLHDGEVVHHLDGNRRNNRKSNLLILDDSQHRKLHIWLRKGAPYTNKCKVYDVKDVLVECKVCGDTLTRKDQDTYCSNKCAMHGQRKVDRPSKEQLILDINELSWVSIGKKYGVSDNAVRKWAKKYEIVQ